ncbi:orotidine-5'-phosphate decarboxylase [Furfurilactobacillus sp. WILCCON 0119]
MLKPIILALDVASLAATDQLLDQLTPHHHPVIKVGMALFYSMGPSLITHLQARGCDIFLDLKLHDIPTAVEQAAFQIGQLGVQYTTVHALGGTKMMIAAKRGLRFGALTAHVTPPKLLAITELTSVSELALNHEQRVTGTMTDQVNHLTALANQAGVDGIICSPQELPRLRQWVPDDFLLVTPGIRPVGSTTDDQLRTMTPTAAIAAGSSALVIGRPITQAANPLTAYQAVIKELATC